MPYRPTAAATRVMIVDDHEALRQGIRGRLEQELDMRIVGELCSGDELFAALEQQPAPDVLLLDLQMGTFQAAEAIPTIRRHWPDVKILIVTAHDDRARFRPVVEAGIDGYMLKDEELRTFPRAIREVVRGGQYYSQKMVGFLLGEKGAPEPTAREREALALVAQSLTSVEIGQRLGLSRRTVDTYIQRVRAKLGADTRGAAAAKAVELGYISALNGGLGENGKQP